MDMFTTDQQRALLTLARASVEHAVRKGGLLYAKDIDEAFRPDRGAFVTLHLEGALRGCIGYPEAVFPLYQAIIRGAAGAALSDPRFPPVSREEVGALEIEISVLSLLAPIQPDDVVVGTHGLVIEHGEARGLLLPQVPTEWGWDREQFLHHTSLKAGLPGDAWRQGATLFAFTAEVFGEAFE